VIAHAAVAVTSKNASTAAHAVTTRHNSTHGK
jgi:hypothetical protein